MCSTQLKSYGARSCQKLLLSAVAAMSVAGMAAIAAHGSTVDTWKVSGNGNWDATSANWTTNNAGGVYADGNAVVFPNSLGGTITVTNVSGNGGVTPASVEFSDVNTTGGNYTFVAGTGVTQGIEGAATTVQLDTAYNGTVTMNLANTYAGGTTINGGILQLQLTGSSSAPTTVNQLGSGTVTVNGGQLELSPNGSPSTGDVYNLNNNIALNGGAVFAADGLEHLTGTVNVTGTSATLAEQYGGKDLFVDGPLTGSGALQVTHFGSNSFGEGTVHIGGANNTYSGTIRVDAGSLAIDNNSALVHANIIDNSNYSANSSIQDAGVMFTGPAGDYSNVSVHSLTITRQGTLSLTNGTIPVTLAATDGLVLGTAGYGAAAIINFLLTTPGNSSELLVTGGDFTVAAPVTLNLAGGTGFADGSSYELLNWAGAATPTAITLADFNLGTHSGTQSLTISGDALYYRAAPVPEPASLGLVALGAIGLLLLKKRIRPAV